WRALPIGRKPTGRVPSYCLWTDGRASALRRRFACRPTACGIGAGFRSRGSAGAARPQGAWSRAEEGAGRLEGDRGAVGAGSIGAAELDAAALDRRDREAHRRAHLKITAQRGPEKGGFAWRRPRHTLKGRQDADAVDR